MSHKGWGHEPLPVRSQRMAEVSTPTSSNMRESLQRTAKRPKQLTAAQRAALREQLQAMRFLSSPIMGKNVGVEQGHGTRIVVLLW